jgi:DNA modification methylase
MISTATSPQVDQKRTSLLNKYRARILPNPQINRSLVSFQANRNLPFFGWFKYKEGFSADLVDDLIGESGTKEGVLLDPFAGAGTALFVGSSRGLDSTGIEISPVAAYIVESRLAAERVPPKELKRFLDRTAKLDWRRLFSSEHSFQHIPITEGAFSADNEQAISGFRAYCADSVRDRGLRQLLDFACLSVLETVSFTRKDGQYLRWDYRVEKERIVSSFDKGDIPDFNTAIRKKLLRITQDLERRHTNVHWFEPVSNSPSPGLIDLRLGSCLDLLPLIEKDSVDLVFTSPPYCNRYDYTRTYALELAYLGYDAESVKRLRQSMLSCTVENRAKVTEIEASYRRQGRYAAFGEILRVFDRQEALYEVLGILDRLASDEMLNNSNIPRMVRNYFFEMCVVIHEVARVLRRGGRVIMVNDNVRYAGEEVPVDLILSDFAEQFGLKAENIWVLGRGKGNSSQQMGAHGRSELRKCVYQWRKE